MLLKKHEIEFLESKKGKKGKGKGKTKRDGTPKPRSASREIMKSKSGIDWVDINGKKLPNCCMAFKAEGKCGYKERTGYD